MVSLMSSRRRIRRLGRRFWGEWGGWEGTEVINLFMTDVRLIDGDAAR